MDEADFSEDTTYKQQEDLPYDGDLSQMNTSHDCNFPSKSDVPDILNQVTLTEDAPQEEAAAKETYQKTDMVTTGETITKDVANEKCDEENQCAGMHRIDTKKGDGSKSNISNILLHHLSKEQFSRGPGIDCETLPEISSADSSDEAAIINNIISHYVKTPCPKEQTTELSDQPDPKRDDESSLKPSCSPITTEIPSAMEELVAAGDSSHRGNLNFLTQVKGLCDQQKNCQGRTPQKQPTDTAGTSSGFRYGQDQVHSQLPDFSKVPPKVKILKSHMTNNPLIAAKQASFSLKLRNKSANVQDSLEAMSRSNCAEKHRLPQERKSTGPSRQIQMEPTVPSHQQLLTGIESKTHLLKLSSTSQKDLSLSSFYIFQKISQGKQMCQKLKEETDQLKIKVQEFFKRMKEDSFCSLQDRRLVLEKLQGHLELLEQEFLATTEKHLALQQQIHVHESPAVGDFDPEREVEGEMFRLEMLLEDVKEKIAGSNWTSALSLPESFPVAPHGSAPAASSLSNEGDPSGTRGSLDRAETTAPSPRCAFCSRLLEWKQKMERKPHRQINRGGSVVTGKKAPHQGRTLGSDTGPSSCSDSDAGLQSHRCENCGTQIHGSPSVCSKGPLKGFYYRYNTPGQKYLNHSRRGTFVQPRSLDGNKSSLPPCLKPKRICSQRMNSKSSRDEHELTPGKKEGWSQEDEKVSGSKPLCDFNSTEETKSKILNSTLDHALKTATILKKTTDQMIRAIAEDLAKAQRWRSQLKYY